MRPLAGPPAELVAEAVELAVRAPSIHNTQPWQWRLTATALELYVDGTRQLRAADTSGRMLLISCGAALHHLTVAMAARGWASTVVRLPDARVPSLLASISFRPSPVTQELAAWADAISKRRSDRRQMSSWEVPAGHLHTLVALAASHGVVAEPLVDAADEFLWDSLTQGVSDKRQDDSAYQGELGRWAGVDVSARQGLPAANLVDIPGPVASESPEHRFPSGTWRQPGENNEAPGSVAMLLCTSSDDALSRLRAGEALSAVLLEATRVGLATRLDSQAVEDEPTRAQLEERLLAGARSPQIVMHVGWPGGSDPVPPTPRRESRHVLKVTDSPSMSAQLAGSIRAGDHSTTEGDSR